MRAGKRKRKTRRESTFCELESILLVFLALANFGMSVCVVGSAGKDREKEHDFEPVLSFMEVNISNRTF